MRNIAIVGASELGRAVAGRAEISGFQTVLLDLTGAAGGRSAPGVRIAASIEDAVRSADLVLEAAPDDLETKLEVFTILDRSAPPGAMLATTTSALSVTEIASITLRAARVFGLHFTPPVGLGSLVEVVQALETSEEAMQAAAAVCRQMGLETVRVRESQGLVNQRLRALLANEAFALLQEGVARPEDIDRAFCLADGSKVGPLAGADALGLDNLLQELERLQRAFGERFRPNALLAQYVKAGRTGRRAGKGVFDYGPR
jgi:3-hydroxybutyryl-CoA dehydrogenase